MLDRRVVRVIALTAYLSCPAVALSQTGTVTGVVTESRAGQPVPGARVQALSATTIVGATQTRDDGSFRLVLEPGTYTIVVNRIGYRPGNASVTVSSGGTASADVTLTEAATELNPVVTVASRREEKALDAPASVAVVEVRAIQERPSVTAADHVEGMAGVNVSKGGVAQSNIVARGFNNAFSGSLLTLQDYRFAGVPSLRVNVPLLFTSTNEDIERIEVLLGPASALYGPNSSHGVLHVITKSPFTSQGTTLTLDGGQQSLLRLAGRHAGIAGDRFGFKVSGEYFAAQDWEFTDPGEPDVFPAEAPPGRAGQPNTRNFDLRRYVGEARFDFRPDENSEYVTTFGLSQIVSGLEYTGANGTGYAKDWRYQSIQQRARIGRLFGQVFMNMSDAGNSSGESLDGTYLLRSGQPIVDQSRVLAAQIQHGLSIGSRQDFVYGVDYISTNPRTAGTTNGRNEDVDDVREIGGYVQSTTRLSDRFDFVAAARVDQNDQVEGTQFSPRAAVIFKPSPTQNFRVTYNRAFQTPANFTWFLDLIRERNLGGLPYNVRAVGNPPKTGWSFNRSCDAPSNGGLCMRSMFAGSDTWQPATAAAAFPGVIAANSAAISGSLTQSIVDALTMPPFNVPQQQAAAIAAQMAPQIVGFLGTLTPTGSQIGTEMRMIVPGSPNLSAADVRDIGPIKASFNNTWEIGYKGIVGSRLRVAIDAWSEKRGDVGNPADLATPNIFFNPASLQAYTAASLQPVLKAALMQQLGLPEPNADVVAASFAGQIGQQLAGGFAPLPLGIVTFDSDAFASAHDIYATYSSYDATITVNGLDLALDYVANDNWTLGGQFSWVSDDVFPTVTSSNNRPLMLNAPTQRAALSAAFRSTDGSWGFDVRNRLTNAYPVNSGVYATGVTFQRPGSDDAYTYDGFTEHCTRESVTYSCLKSANVVDLGFNWRKPLGTRQVLFSLRIDNAFDQQYRTMPGTPLIGRMISTRWQYSF